MFVVLALSGAGFLIGYAFEIHALAGVLLLSIFTGLAIGLIVALVRKAIDQGWF